MAERIILDGWKSESSKRKSPDAGTSERKSDNPEEDSDDDRNKKSPKQARHSEKTNQPENLPPSQSSSVCTLTEKVLCNDLPMSSRARVRVLCMINNAQ